MFWWPVTGEIAGDSGRERENREGGERGKEEEGKKKKARVNPGDKYTWGQLRSFLNSNAVD